MTDNSYLQGLSKVGAAFGPLTVAFIGSSTMQRFFGATAVTPALANPGNDSFWGAALAFLKAPWRVVGVLGTDGATFDTRAYDGPELIARTRPNIVVLGLGVNDMNLTALPTVTSRLDYVSAYVRQVAATGGVVIIPTIHALSFSNTAVKAAWMADFNSRLLQMGENNPNLLVLNIAVLALVHDVSGTYATMSSSYSTDLVHWNSAGCVIVGRELARQISLKAPHLLRGGDLFVNNLGVATTDPRGIIRNGLNLGSQSASGGVTGTMPAAPWETANLGTNHAAVASIVARDATDPIPGNWVRFEVTQGLSWTALSNRVIIRRNSLDFAGAGVPVGTWMQAMAEVRWPNATIASDGAPYPSLQFVNNAGTSVTVQTGQQAFNNVPILWRAGEVIVLRTAPFKLFATTSTHRLDLTFFTQAVSSGYTVDVGRMGLDILDFTNTIV